MIEQLILCPDHTPGEHDLRDDFWLYLPVLGPSTTVMLKYCADLLADKAAADFVMVRTADFGSRFGLSPVRLHASIDRAVGFRCATWLSADVLGVRMQLPRLHSGLIARLPADLVPAYSQVPA